MGRGVLEVLENSALGGPRLHSWSGCASARLPAPGAPLRNQFVAGPSAPAGFRTAWGRRTLLRSPGLGCVPHPDLGWRFRGARIGGRAVGPVLDGDRPRSLPFAAGGGTALGGGRWLAGGQRVGSSSITWSMRRVRSKPHARGPIAGPTLSPQDKTVQYLFSQCPSVPRHLLIDLIIL